MKRFIFLATVLLYLFTGAACGSVAATSTKTAEQEAYNMATVTNAPTQVPATTVPTKVPTTPTSTPTPVPTPEPTATPIPLSKQDQLIREGLEKGTVGTGTKVAVYDSVNDVYYLTLPFVPEGLQASTPDEIGYIVQFIYVEDLKKCYMDFIVWNHGVQTAYARCSVPDTLEEMAPRYRVGRLSRGVIYLYLDDLSNWILETVKAYDFTRQLDYMEDMSGLDAEATKFVGYDENKGIYTMDVIPEERQAKTLKQVGYILSFRSEMREVTGNYLASGMVKGKSEIFSGKIIQASTGEVRGTFSFGGAAPKSIPYNPYKEPTFYEVATLERIGEEIDKYLPPAA